MLSSRLLALAILFVGVLGLLQSSSTSIATNQPTVRTSRLPNGPGKEHPKHHGHHKHHSHKSHQPHPHHPHRPHRPHHPHHPYHPHHPHHPPYSRRALYDVTAPNASVTTNETVRLNVTLATGNETSSLNTTLHLNVSTIGHANETVKLNVSVVDNGAINGTSQPSMTTILFNSAAKVNVTPSNNTVALNTSTVTTSSTEVNATETPIKRSRPYQIFDCSHFAKHPVTTTTSAHKTYPTVNAVSVQRHCYTPRNEDSTPAPAPTTSSTSTNEENTAIRQSEAASTMSTPTDALASGLHDKRSKKRCTTTSLFQIYPPESEGQIVASSSSGGRYKTWRYNVRCKTGTTPPVTLITSTKTVLTYVPLSSFSTTSTSTSTSTDE